MKDRGRFWLVPKSVALDALLQGLRARIRPAVWAGQHKLAVLSCEEAQKVEWKVSWPVAGGCNLRIRPRFTQDANESRRHLPQNPTVVDAVRQQHWRLDLQATFKMEERPQCTQL